jgi:uncharacterized protein (TIGR03435 family)
MKQPGSIDWNLVRAVGRGAAVSAFLVSFAVGWAQGTGPAPGGSETVPEFEAATIKPVKDANPNWKTDREEGRRFFASNRSLVELLLMAYHLDRRQIVGGPGWVSTDTYDLTAVAENDKEMQQHGREMFQKLLTDRFQLAFHWEQRDMPVYVMTVAKGGSKLKAADANGAHESGCQRPGQCMFRREDVQHFANWLQFAVVDKPVVDKTGLSGEFDFTLKWTPDESQFFAMGIHAPPPSDDPNAPPPLFQAIEDQLGLKLAAQKTSTQVMVIDHVERPAED